MTIESSIVCCWPLKHSNIKQVGKLFGNDCCSGSFFFEDVSLRGQRPLNRGWKWQRIKKLSDLIISPLSFSCGINGEKACRTWRPELAPPFEADFEQIRIQTSRTVNPDHPVDEAPAPQILSRFIKIARRIASRPNTLGAVLRPGKQGTRGNLAA